MRSPGCGARSATTGRPRSDTKRPCAAYCCGSHRVSVSLNISCLTSLSAVGDALMPPSMVPVIRPLRRKPLMEGHDKPCVRGRVANLGAMGEGSVLHINVLRTGLERG